MTGQIDSGVVTLGSGSKPDVFVSTMPSLIMLPIVNANATEMAMMSTETYREKVRND